MADVSSGMISQIERGMANPSLKVLEKLRTALQVPLSTLIEARLADQEDARNPGFVRRLAERPTFTVGPAPLMKEMLSPAGIEGMQLMIIHFPPHADPVDVVLGHGQKGGLVLSGEVRLMVDGEETALYEGDSFQFDSMLEHSIRNDTDHQASVLWVMGPFRQAHF